MAQNEIHQEDERRLILNMLQGGKLTPEEADELLAAIDAAEAAESGSNAEGAEDSGSAATAPTPPTPAASPANGRGDLGGLGDDIAGAIREVLLEAREAINSGLTAAGDVTRSVMRENRTAIRDTVRQSVRRAAHEARNAARAARHEARQAARQAKMEARRATAGLWGTHVSEEAALTHVLKPGGRLTVRIPRGGIEISAWDRDEVSVEAHAHARGSSDADVRQLLGAVRVSLEEQGPDLVLKSTQAKLPEASGSGQAWVDLEIQVPQNVDLDLTSTYSDIEVTGTRGLHRIQLERGDAEIRGAGGRFEIRVKQGDIEMDRCTAQSVLLEGDHGDVEAEFEPAGAGPFEVQSVYADCELTIPAGAAFDLEASAVDGDLEVKLPGGMPATSTSHSWRGKVNGGGPTIKVSSIRGDINVRA